MKTDKLLHLVQQKKAMRSGGALPLPKAQRGIVNQNAYDLWYKYNTPEGRAGMPDVYSNYDYRKYFEDAVTGVNPMGFDEESMHFPDTYKYPWHPSFSDESIYYVNQKETPGLSYQTKQRGGLAKAQNGLETLVAQYKDLQDKINKGYGKEDVYIKKLKEVSDKLVNEKFALEETDLVPQDVRDNPTTTGYCIGTACYLANQAGDPFNYFSNSMAQDAARDNPESTRYLEQSEKYIEPGDIIQYKKGNLEKSFPDHAYTVLEIGEPDQNGFKPVKVVGSPGTGPVQYKDYYLGPDNKIYRNPGTSPMATQLLKRKDKDSNAYNDIINQRNELKKAIEAIQPDYFNPKPTVRSGDFLPTDFLFSQSGWYGGNPENYSYDNPDRETTYTLGPTGENRFAEQIYPKEAKLPEILSQISNPSYKKEFMNKYNITSREYDAIAKNMLGIYGAESKFGTDYWGKPVPEPQGLSKFLDKTSEFIDDFPFPVNQLSNAVPQYGSVGPFQINRKSLSKNLRKKYSKEDLYDPIKASEATMEFLAEGLTGKGMNLRKRAKKEKDSPMYMENVNPENYLDYLSYLHNQPSWLTGDVKTKQLYGDVVAGEHPYKKLVDYYSSLFDVMPSSISTPVEVVDQVPYEWKRKGGLTKAQAGTAYVESLCGPGYIESVDESGNKICVDPSTQPQRPDIGYQLRQQYKDERPMVFAGYNGPYDDITEFYRSISAPLESNYSGYCPECEENQKRSFNFPNINLGNLFNNMFQGKPKYLRTPRAKKCKGPDCYKFQNAGVYDALLKYKERPDENKWEFLEPSGVTSWDDAARGYDSWQKSGQTFPTLDEGMDMFSAVPLFGKLGKVHKGIKMARASWKPAVNKLYELADYVREEKNKKSGGLAKAQLGPTVQSARQQALQKASSPQFDPRLVQAILASANQPVTNSLGRVISTPESRDKAWREKRVNKDAGKYSVSDYIAGIPEPGADNNVLSDPIAMAAMLAALPAAGATSLGTRFLSNLGDEVIFNTVAGMDPTGLTPTALSLGTRGNLTGRLASAYDRAGRQAFNVNSNLGVLDALPENFNVRSKTARDQVAAKLAETGIFPRGETLTDIASAINNPNVNSPVVSYIRNNPELRRKLAYLTRDLNRDYNLDIDIASIRTPQELNTLYDRATQFLSSNSPIASNVRSLFTDADLQRLRSELNATTRSGQSSRVSIPTSSGSPIEMVRSGNDYVFESPASGARMTFNFDPDLNIASGFGFFNRANSSNARQARMDSGNMFRLATTNAPRNFCTTEGCLSSDSYPLLWSLGAGDRPFRLLNPANYPRNQSRPWDMFTSMDERWKADAVANLTNRDLALLDQQSPNALGRYSPYAEVFGQPSVHNKEQLANFLNAQNSLYEISNDVLQSQLNRGLISPTMYDANIVKWLNDPANPNAGLSIKAPKLTEAEINLPLEQRQRFLPHQIPDDSKLRHPVFTRMALGPDMPNPLLSSDPVIRATQPGRGIYQYLADPDAAINSSARIRFMQPIPVFQKMYGRGGLTAAKAREILHDKSVHGKPLTEKQRKFFGAVSSGKKIRVKLNK